jgi:hypothetical protein
MLMLGLKGTNKDSAYVLSWMGALLTHDVGIVAKASFVMVFTEGD